MKLATLTVTIVAEAAALFGMYEIHQDLYIIAVNSLTIAENTRQPVQIGITGFTPQAQKTMEDLMTDEKQTGRKK